MFTYNVTLGHVHANIFAVEFNKYYIYRERVCSLMFQVCNAHATYCFLGPSQLYNIFNIIAKTAGYTRKVVEF